MLNLIHGILATCHRMPLCRQSTCSMVSKTAIHDNFLASSVRLSKIVKTILTISKMRKKQRMLTHRKAGESRGKSKWQILTREHREKKNLTGKPGSQQGGRRAITRHRRSTEAQGVRRSRDTGTRKKRAEQMVWLMERVQHTLAEIPANRGGTQTTTRHLTLRNIGLFSQAVVGSFVCLLAARRWRLQTDFAGFFGRGQNSGTLGFLTIDRL